jgi:hypothetical protein
MHKAWSLASKTSRPCDTEAALKSAHILCHTDKSEDPDLLAPKSMVIHTHTHTHTHTCHAATSSELSALAQLQECVAWP